MRKVIFGILLVGLVAATHPKGVIESLATALATTVNTNITVEVTATPLPDGTIRLDMTATSYDGLPVTRFDVFQDGAWIATVTNPPIAPTSLKMQ